MKFLAFAAAGALALAIATPSAATVILGTGAGVVQPDENVLFTNNPPIGLSIMGVTNNTGSGVSISGGEALVGNGGQARVDASDGSISSLFTFAGLANQTLGFDLSNPSLAFTQAEFRVFVGKGTATNLTVTAYDTTGQQFQNTFAIPSNGFFYANTSHNQLIDRFSISANGTVQDVRQIRIGGVTAVPTAVPELSSWVLMIVGFGGVGVLLRRRRALATFA